MTQYIPTSKKAIDLTGQKFGRWLVLACAGIDENRRLLWLCRCDCGTERAVNGKSLRQGISKSCGCISKEPRPHRKNLLGQRFNRLVVIAEAGHNKDMRMKWLCRCDCGNEITATGKDLQRRNVMSCGCLYRETRGIRQRTHGMSNTRVFKIWQGMIERCTNPNQPNYVQYGERGITICEQWLSSFEAFYADMGEPPTNKHTLDRIDNDLGYGPYNCRWATRLEQGRNRRKVMKITIDGVTRSAPEWAEMVGISARAITIRIRKGVPPKTAVFHPAQPGTSIKVSDHEDNTMSQGLLFP